MVTLLPAILALLNTRKNRVLLLAEAAMPPTQFQAFRRLFLNEFGKSGLEQELVRVFVEGSDKDRHGKGRNT